MAAQDPIGGGWRYEPHQPGDTSVTGWQLMALKSGQMAYLTVDPAVFDGQDVSEVGHHRPGGHFSYLAGGKLLKDEESCGQRRRPAVPAISAACREPTRRWSRARLC